MRIRARRTAVLATLALAGGAITACTPVPYTFRLTNRTDQALSVRWGPGQLGAVDARATSKITIPSQLTCIEEPVRVVTADGELAAVLDDGPICPDGHIELTQERLAPATATATVVNTTGTDVDLSFITGAHLTAAPGAQVDVPLQVPAGECVYLPTNQYEFSRFAEIPPFWGGDLCDGEVKPLSLTEPATAVVDNRTARDLTVLDGTTVLGTVAARARATVPLTSTECVAGRLRVLDAARTRTTTLPATVCPTDVLVVNTLARAATVTLTNASDVAVGLTFTGEMLSTTGVTLEPHESRRLSLQSPPGTCVLADGRQGPDAPPYATWNGYLCDGARLTAQVDTRPDHPELSWEASW